MKVSVIVPAFNEEKYIKACIESLQNQTVKAAEIIVVDNNCTDRTIEIASKFDVRIVQEPKQGMTYSRAKGFSSGKSEILARCDADSQLPTNWIERIVYNFTKRRHIDALIGLNTVYDFPIKNVKLINKASVYLIKEIAGHYPLFGSSMAIKKKIWDEIKDDLCDDNFEYHEDVDISVHIHKLGGIIVFDPHFESQFSARRFKRDPYEIFVEYPSRILKTIRGHKI